MIRLNPSGATFKIPESWLKWHAGFKNNLHLTRAELDKVKTAEGNWDKEYAHIANELLPFSQCVAHVGGEGWGRDAVSYADLQLRALRRPPGLPPYPAVGAARIWRSANHGPSSAFTASGTSTFADPT